MRIALINDQPQNSGMGRYAYKLLEKLPKTCNDIIIDHWYIDYKTRQLKLNDKAVKNYLAVPFIDNKFLFISRIKLKLPEYDIYHFANQNLSTLVKGDIRRRQTVITCHDISPMSCPSNFIEYVLRKYLYSGIKKFNNIITDSESTKADLIRIYDIPSSKIGVIYLGVDNNIFKPIDKLEARSKLGTRDDFKILINVGREKNIFTLLKAFSIINSKIPNIKLIRVGPTSKRTTRLISNLKLGNSIICFSSVSDEKLALLYSSSDLGIFTSYYEGFGLPILEAMACGIPVVASNATSIPEIVGDSGILVAPFDYNEFANQSINILSDSDCFNKYQAKAIERAQFFSWDKTLRETTAVYKRIINEN